MTGILISLFLFLGCLCLVVIGAKWYLKAIVSWLVESRHRQLEIIATTGAVPEVWSRKYNRKLTRLLKEGKAEIAIPIREAAQKSYRRKLRRLESYAKTTNLVENEQVRSQLLEALHKAGSRWHEEVRSPYEEHDR